MPSRKGGWQSARGATSPAPGRGRSLTMKIFRKVAEPATYKVVGHDGPRNLTPSVLNTFPINIAVQPGDLVGFNQENPASGGFMMGDTSCQFDAPGELSFHSGNLPDDASGSFIVGANDVRLNIKAVVAMKAENDFEFGKVTRNKNKGTATLAVDVPGSGTLSLAGKGVKPQRADRALRAVASKTVTAAGTVKLRIKAKGKRKQRLNETGKARVKVQVTYTPSGVDTGDVPGDPNTHSRKVRLVKR